jgi:hypothetical protein
LKTVRNRRPAQKPVFIIQPFDPNNVEHLKGNMTITLNKALAFSLTRFIKESELDESEGYIYAMQGHISRWFNDRSKEIKSRQLNTDVVQSDVEMKQTEENTEEKN